jgi:hypothetical protein
MIHMENDDQKFYVKTLKNNYVLELWGSVLR